MSSLHKLNVNIHVYLLHCHNLTGNIDNPDRAVDGKYGNYVLESDIFGSDAMLQHADTLIGINRPAKQKIRLYGPDRYVIKDDRH